MESQPDCKFCGTYDLSEARKHPDTRHVASHQNDSLDKLHCWYSQNHNPAGGILVLPTGGGKTFTAVRFLCRGPLSEGYRVLWLAQTHHLLEQGYHEIVRSAGNIAEPKRELALRVVSATPGHMPVHSIKPVDDVLIGTLATLCRAFKDRHPSFEKFLDEAGSKLFVVFDEAHHSPAPSYRTFINGLRERCSGLKLLGLTATPRYADETRSGWLQKLFPQTILYSVAPATLMAANILARPIIEEPRTNIEAQFDDREYQKWVGTNADLPEEIITKLAENRDRNAFIVDAYVRDRVKYGKTIIFADRWYQCDYLREALLKRGVRADVVYSHVDADRRGVEARNRRDKDENHRVLERFKKGELDVLINVRMLTEGTDVPDVQSVFLTRQTTSEVLVTQMVGRALRGTKFGGTSAAYIVSFVDKWRQLINWASYDQLLEGGTGEAPTEYGKRPPLQLISIELVRKLARQMDSGVNVESGPFLTRLPVGWYRVEYLARVPGSDDNEPRRVLVMVFEHEREAYARFVEFIAHQDLERLTDEAVVLADVRDLVASWVATFFRDADDHLASDLAVDLFDIARHVAYAGLPPRFFPFEERGAHDLDQLARETIDRNLGLRETDQALRAEYNRVDRYWGTLYFPYALFKSQFNACCERILLAETHGADPATYVPKPVVTEPIPPREPSEDLKHQVRRRDNDSCVCCGENSARRLQVDHIHPFYFGGSNLLDNLQTLCTECNLLKGTLTINFRDPQTDLTAPPDRMQELEPPRGADIASSEAWVRFLCRTIDVFYRCGAVHSVWIPERGTGFHQWKIELNAGNDPRWIEPHLKRLLSRIRARKAEAGYGAPTSITVFAPDMPHVTSAIEDGGGDDAQPESAIGDDELAVMNVAEVRRRRTEARLAELTGLPQATVERKLTEAHGKTLVRNLFDAQWPAQANGPDSDKLGALTVFSAREQGLSDSIAQVTGLSKATVQRRLTETHGRMFVSNAFADRWPGNEGIDSLGQFSVAEARADGKAPTIAAITHLAVSEVERQLAEAHGKTLVRNLFGSAWPGNDDPTKLGRLSVGEVRVQGLVDTIARLTGLTPPTVQRRLRSAHGKTLLRNAFESEWPEEG